MTRSTVLGEYVPMATRPATLDDLGLVTETLTLAFLHDPVWSVALARPDGSTVHHAAYWQLYVEGALRYSTVLMTDDASAVSVWVPPDGTELSNAGEEALERLVKATLEPAAVRAMFELWARFAANRPHDEPHAYLSLLATHPDHRGQGIGQRLLMEDLARWDAAGVPAYLESTNPGNDHRYERAGFRRVGGFRAVLDNGPISTMWRPSQASTRVEGR
ncbi:MAG: GNAT family N-acetyltransferase [Candidatus Limnocylindrales bacterium]